MARTKEKIKDAIRKISDPAYGKMINSPVPPPANKPDDVGKWVWARFEEAMNEKRRLNINGKHLRNHELYRGKHWPKPGQKGLLTAGLPFHTVEHTVANLTDSKPQFDIRAYEEGRKEQATTLHKVGSAWWLETEQQDVLEESARNMENYGTTIEKMVFDHSYYGGDAEVDIVDPFTFVGEPKQRKIQKMRYCFHFYPETISRIIETYGEKKGIKVKPQETFPEMGEEREQNYGGSVAKLAPTGNLPSTYGREAISAGDSTGINRGFMVECWVRGVNPEPYQTIQDLETGQEYKPEEFPSEMALTMSENPERFQRNSREKYPGGIRVITVANDGGLILDDVGNPMINPNLPREQVQDCYLYKNFPFIAGQSYTDGLSFWGFSLMEQTEIIVMEINKWISKISEAVDKILKMPIINPRNSGIPDTDLKKGILHPKNHIVAQSLRFLQTYGIPDQTFKFVELLKLIYDQVTGIHDVEEGRKPTGITAASAIVALQEKAQVIIRRKIRTIDRIVRERGRMYISMVINWHTEIRQAIYETQPEPETVEYRGTDLYGRYQFKEEAGSTLPTSKLFQREEAAKLYQEGAFGQPGSPEAAESLLEELNYPNKQEIINRFRMGTVGMIAQKLEMAGYPPETVQEFAQIAMMEPEQIQKAIQEREAAMAQGRAA